YGVDAYDNNTGLEDQATQASWLGQSAMEIINSQLTIGGTLNEYSDEYWLAGNEWSHDTGGWPSAAGVLPDNYANVEWWGIASVADNGTEPDIVTLRQAANSLREVFANVSMVGSGQQYATIEDALADPEHKDIIYVYPGTYNVGILEINESITLEGRESPQPVINGNLVFLETQATVQNFTIYYSEGQNIAYTSSDGTYAGWDIMADAGVTAVNSVITLKDCVIQPNPPLSRYGKGIQIWNLYGTGEISPLIENCQISNTDSSIYLYSQSFGGAILGEIKNNTLDANNYGVVLRMHKEKPFIRYNEITNSVNGIHITYEDGALLGERLSNIANNAFSGNADDIWCDELGQ
ncbi:MAG: NosD domain-containing protein, partial [Candidatus Omnitrophota bacterium]|nr:NosD domain-containing protein [Candidatus Omnitrophota bacterium]